MSDSSPVVRCAIYTRESTEEGLEQQFNSLQAQRESAEAYILSQKQNGWQALTRAYNDGATAERVSSARLWRSCFRTSRPVVSIAWWSTRSIG